MKNVYVIFCQMTNIDGSTTIHAVQTFAYANKQRALDVCNKLNRVFPPLEPDNVTYVPRPLLLDESEGPA